MMVCRWTFFSFFLRYETCSILTVPSSQRWSNSSNVLRLSAHLQPFIMKLHQLLKLYTSIPKFTNWVINQKVAQSSYVLLVAATTVPFSKVLSSQCDFHGCLQRKLVFNSLWCWREASRKTSNKKKTCLKSVCTHGGLMNIIYTLQEKACFSHLCETLPAVHKSNAAECVLFYSVDAFEVHFMMDVWA